MVKKQNKQIISFSTYKIITLLKLNQSMQQLYQVIKQRFDRLQMGAHNKLTVEQYRDLKQEQKARCQKQSWILSMFRAKKTTINANIKSNFYRYSYQIMKVIDPKFQFQFEPNLSDETFLNDFVCLYTRFFDNYEDKFQFKVKIRNLLRPTNHNIINDMIKYLSDFSRDYSQHLFMWQLKQAKKAQQTCEQSNKKLQMSTNMQSSLYSGSPSSLSNNLTKQKPLQIFRNSVNYTEFGIKRYNDDNQNQLNFRKSQLNKIYGLLDIQPFPNYVYLDKIKNNVDILRLRMNEIYRDMKYRNHYIKSSIIFYSNAYNSRFNSQSINNTLNMKPNLIEDSHPFISHPFRVSLAIQKNGFSCINITTVQKKQQKEQRNLSPLKQKVRLSSVSNKEIPNPNMISKTNNKGQFVLNSLKVLRISENFLPPLKQATPRLNSEQQKLKEAQSLIRKISFTNTQNLINLQVQTGKQMQQISNCGVLYYNQQILKQAERRQNQKKRMNQLRKHFTSEQKSKKGNRRADPQQKISQWLDKINVMKQLQRKKILGLS